MTSGDLLKDMRPLGVFEDGTPLKIQLVGNEGGGNLLSVGTTRSGKTHFMALVGCQAIQCADAVIPGIIDIGKACIDYEHVDGLDLGDEDQGFGFDVAGVDLARDIFQAEALLRSLKELIRRRVERDLPRLPRVVVVIDEFRSLLGQSKIAAEVMVGMAQICLAVNVTFIFGSQRATENFMPNDLTALTRNVVCFTTRKSEEGRYVFGEKSKADPSKLMMKSGQCWASTTDHPHEARAGTHHATREAICRAVRACRQQPTLDDLHAGWTGGDDFVRRPNLWPTPFPGAIALGPATSSTGDAKVQRILDALDDVGPSRAGTIRSVTGLGGKAFDLALKRSIDLGHVVVASRTKHGQRAVPIYARAFARAKGA